VPKLMIATPAYGEIFYAPYVQSVLLLARLAHKDKWDFMFESISYAEVSEARNYLVTRFFDKTDATHLLFVDADMGFPARLVTDMLAIGKPVVISSVWPIWRDASPIPAAPSRRRMNSSCAACRRQGCRRTVSWKSKPAAQAYF